jgi:hypothetical protein
MQTNTLPEFQSLSTFLAADVLSGVPPLSTLPIFLATKAKNDCTSDASNRGISYTYIWGSEHQKYSLTIAR